MRRRRRPLAPGSSRRPSRAVKGWLDMAEFGCQARRGGQPAAGVALDMAETGGRPIPQGR